MNWPQNWLFCLQWQCSIYHVNGTRTKAYIQTLMLQEIISTSVLQYLFPVIGRIDRRESPQGQRPSPPVDLILKSDESL